MSLVSSKGSFHGDRRSFDSPTPNLPTEIWHYIASLIPFSTFKKSKLYAVNKNLLGYYLGMEYKYLRLGFLCDMYAEKTARQPRLWSEKVTAIRTFPFLARFTRRLELSFWEGRDPIKAEYQDMRRARVRSLVSPLRRILPCLSVKMEHLDPVFDAVLYLSPLEHMAEAMPHFKHLTSLTCYLSHHEEHHGTIPFETILPSIASIAWTASRSSLTQLHLELRLSFIPDLHLDEITFPNLREFHIVIRQLNKYIGPNPLHLVNLTRATHTLLCFFSKHRHQILTLLLAIPNSQALDDMLNDIPYFPRLVDLTLRLCVAYNTPLIASLSMFLCRQSTTIEHFYPEFYLDMDIPPQPDSGSDLPSAVLECWKSASCLNVSFPNLKYLEVDFEDKAVLLWYISTFVSQVHELEIRRYLSYSSLEAFVKILGSTASRGQQLHTLHLQLDTFGPRILRLLATGLPYVRTLHLWHSHDSTFEIPWDIVTTWSETAPVRYPTWGLENLFFPGMRSVSHRCKKFRAVLVNMLPSVKYINGLDPDEFVNSGLAAGQSLGVQLAI